MDLSDEQFQEVQILAFTFWKEEGEIPDLPQELTDANWFRAEDGLREKFQEQNRHNHHRQFHTEFLS